MKRLSMALLIVLISFSPLYAVKRSVARSGAHSHHRAHPVQRVQYGVASWYGPKDQGRLMACGEPFDEHQLIAAHRTLPLGSRVKVTNLRNGRSVIVRIKDRGPAIAGRLIDVSRAAARRLGFSHGGLARVKVRVLSVPAHKSESGQAGE
ncbi:MAG: septal ring lytic transglycosylase RlpA family protein [Terriglobia bacterium]